VNVLIAIGCDSYVKLLKLNGAERDASEVFALLASAGDYDKAVSRVLLSPNLTNLKAALDAAFPTGQEVDVFTFFFAGHGVAKAGSFYLCTCESDAERLSTTAFPIVELFTLVNEFHPGQVNIIVDACQAGASSYDLGQLQKPEVIGSSDASSIAFLGACSSNEYANEELDGGVMTKELVKCLNGETQVQTTWPFLDLVSVGNVVSRSVQRIMPDQKPICWGLSLFGNGRLATNPHFEDSGIERSFPIGTVRPQSQIGKKIRELSSTLWTEYRGITDDFSPRRLLAVIENVVAGAADDLSSVISFLHGLQQTLAQKTTSSIDSLLPSQCLLTCAVSILRYTDAPAVKQYLAVTLAEVRRRNMETWQELTAAIEADDLTLCDTGNVLPELYYLPLRVTKILGWLGFEITAAELLSDLRDNHDNVRLGLASQILKHYEPSFVAVSEAQAPFLYVFLKACEFKKENELAERVLNLYFASFAANSGNVARAETDGATAYLYMRSLGPPEHRPQNWRPSNPSSLLAVLLLFGAKLKLQSNWDLRALDHRSSGFFIPSSYLDFDRQVIEHGMNFTSRIGHGVWNVRHFEQEFARAMQTGFPSTAADLSKECVALCIAASLLFPDRLPLLLERRLN
jgi:hypothetical protein